jgi:hypothetical protein
MGMHSLELSLDVSDRGHEVDSTSCHQHSGLAGQGHAGESVDLLRGHSVDLIAVLVEVEVSECHVVSGNLLKSVLLSLHCYENVHL